MAQHSGLQSGKPVAPADSAGWYLRLVAHQSAAAAGEDWRAACQARSVLLVDAGRGPPDENPVRGDVAQYRVVAASGKLNDRRHTKRIGPLRTKEEGEVSEKITWRALDEAWETKTAANSQPFPPQTLAFTAPTFFRPCNLSQERYNFLESVPKKEIPDDAYTRFRG